MTHLDTIPPSSKTDSKEKCPPSTEPYKLIGYSHLSPAPILPWPQTDMQWHMVSTTPHMGIDWSSHFVKNKGIKTIEKQKIKTNEQNGQNFKTILIN
jgi:hypothetical protein